jgi:glutamate synthase (NADPH/NADH) large chain
MVIHQRVEVDHYADQLKALLTLHAKSTHSRLAETILGDFSREMAHFWQIVPKEMLDKLEIPVTRAAALTA